MIYLSDEWFAHATSGVADLRFEPSDKSPVTFSYVVDGLPDTHPRAGQTIRYHISLKPSEGTAVLGQGEDRGDVQFVLQYATALDVGSGSRSGSRAFLDGDIRVGGDVAVLIARSNELEILQSALPTPAVRDA